MRSIEIVEPETLQEAIELLDPDDPTVRAVGGGTALMLMMKAGVFKPTRLVSLMSLEPDYSCIHVLPNQELAIGATTSLARLERSGLIRDNAPVITETLRSLSNVRVRNVATIGGHLAHADPHMDLPPVLISLNARILIRGLDGERTVPVEEFFAGYYETTLSRSELITAVIIPSQGTRRSVYLKCTTRAVHDWPALGVAVSVEESGSFVRDARIVISSATHKPVRLPVAEAEACGEITEMTFQKAGDAAAEEAELISDGQGSAAYKKQLVRVYVARALRKALKREGGLNR